MFTPQQVWWSARERCGAEIHDALGHEASDRLGAEGRSLSPEAAIAMAAAELGST